MSCSTSDVVVSMSLLLMFSAAAVLAGVAGGNGLLRIPSNDSLAYCPSRCGDVDISYPFGIGPGCFRQGFELTCNHSAQHPMLFLANSTTQITDLGYDYALLPMFFNITMGPGINTYNMSWVPPAKGITIASYNTFYVIGCDFDVTLFDYGTGDLVGSCMSRCHDEKVPNGGPCNGKGCCNIPLPRDLPGFRFALVRTDGIVAAQSDPLHPGIMAFMSEQYFLSNASDLFSSWTNASKIYGAYLDVAITDQPSCESAQTNSTSYACSSNSNCQNSSSGGYQCSCSGYEQGNPYILNGCIGYNPKHKGHCSTSCGGMNIPFPFGVEEDCFASQRFQLNCTADNLTVINLRDAQYHVTGVSIENGTLTVSNMPNDTSNENEVIIVQSDKDGAVLVEGFVEHDFDLSMEYNIVIRWAVANLTCQTAVRNNNLYACRSVHSYCLHVTHGNIFLGYRCKCSSGYQGNPYLLDGCTDIDECSPPNSCNGTCQNFPGSYKCTSCPRSKEFDPIKRRCVASTKQRNLLLGIAIGIGCGIGSIIVALGATVLANKWKKGIQKRIRRAYFKKNQGLLLEQLISDESATNKTKIFSLEQLKQATNNFDATRVLGRGGHGTVYKCILSDQRVVAIKKSKIVEQTEIDQFINEVAILS